MTSSFQIRPAQGETVRLLFTGDLGATDVTAPLFTAGRFEELYAALQPCMATADVRVANMETPLVRETRDVKSFGVALDGPPETVDAMRFLGIDVANLANNHLTDQGEDGVRSTLDLLHGAGIQTFGGGMNDSEAGAPLVLEQKGIRIGLVGFCQPEQCEAGPDKAGTNVLNRDAVLDSVRALLDEADVVIANVHAGCEYTVIPDLYRVELFREAIDAGAAAVIGHHPHVPQGCETYHDGLIAYSLGNFSFLLKYAADYPLAAKSYMLELEIDVRGVVTADPVPHEIVGPQHAVELMQGDARRAFVEWFGEISDVLKDDAVLERYYAASCWMLFERVYAPRLPKVFEEETVEEATRIAADWIHAMTSVDPHMSLIRTVGELVRDGGADPADLEMVKRLCEG